MQPPKAVSDWQQSTETRIWHGSAKDDDGGCGTEPLGLVPQRFSANRLKGAKPAARSGAGCNSLWRKRSPQTIFFDRLRRPHSINEWGRRQIVNDYLILNSFRLTSIPSQYISMRYVPVGM